MHLYRCITFHFKAERLGYLQRIVAEHVKFPFPSRIEVLTNTSNPDEQEMTYRALVTAGATDAEVIACQIPHRWLLPWASKLSLKAAHESGKFSHFMYSEDDILVRKENIDYFLNDLPMLKKLGLFPGFMRVEWSSERERWIASDINHFYGRIKHDAPKIMARDSGASKNYICPSVSYQAMFLYDKELFEEHLASNTFDVERFGGLENLNDTWGGGVAERAATGIAYHQVPQGFTCRNPIPFWEHYDLIDPACFIHHIPNNYAEREGFWDVSSLIEKAQ